PQLLHDVIPVDPLAVLGDRPLGDVADQTAQVEGVVVGDFFRDHAASGTAASCSDTARSHAACVTASSSSSVRSRATACSGVSGAGFGFVSAVAYCSARSSTASARCSKPFR